MKKHIGLFLDDVKKIYNKGEFNETVALHSTSLAFNRGENVLVIGHNGSGKSTLMNIIDGRVQSSSGNIYYNGKNISHLPIYKRARNVYRLFQESTHGVIPLATIRENMIIASGRRKNRSWFRIVAKKYQNRHFKKIISEFRPELSEKLDTKVISLSPGERQSIVLALLHIQMDSSPQILLADEPTASLDPQMSKKCVDLINEYAKKHWICLTITHDTDIISQHTGRTIELKDGKVISDTFR